MANFRRRSRATKSKPTYKWSGLQAGSTDVSTSGTAFVLVGGTEVEQYGKCTVVSVRGTLEVANSDSDAANGVVKYGIKLMKLNINDAGTITDDAFGIDSHEEDIAKRQLWTQHGVLTKQLADGATHRRQFILNVGVFVILANPKEELIMLLDAGNADRLQANCYLRVLLKLP